MTTTRSSHELNYRYIDLDDLKQTLCGAEFNEKELEAMISDCPSARGGKLTFEDFQACGHLGEYLDE